MPAIAALTINDGTTAQTYSPTVKNGNRVTFRDSATGNIVAGMPSLVHNYVPSTRQKAVDLVEVEIAVPYEETVDGSYVVNDVARGIMKFWIPSRAPSVIRDKLAALCANVLDQADIKSTIENPGAFY